MPTKSTNTLVVVDLPLFVVKFNRDNNGPTTVPWTAFNVPKGASSVTSTLGLFPSFGKSYTGSVGTITYSQGRGNYNPCTHSLMDHRGGFTPVAYEQSFTKSGSNFSVKVTGSMGGSGDYFGIDSVAYPDSNTNALARAAAKLNPLVQTSGFNAPVFIAELRDLSHLWESANRLFGTVANAPRLLSAWNRKIRKNPPRTIADGIRSLAGLDLAVQFGLKPLVSDIRALSGLGYHLSVQRNRLGSEVSRVRSRVYDYGNYSVSLPTGDHPGSVTAGGKRTVCCWMEVRYDKSVIPDPSFNTKLVLDSLGFNKPLTAAWEAIPWSFAVDYFVGIGEFIQQFDRARFVNVPYTVLRKGYSTKTETEYSRYWRLYAGHTGDYKNPGNCYVYSRAYKKAYSRSTTLTLPTLAMPTLHLPDLRQSANLAELVLQKLL